MILSSSPALDQKATLLFGHRMFWKINGSLASFSGSVLVIAVVVSCLASMKIIHSPVAISMISSLIGGWISSAYGYSLFRDGYKAAAFGVVMSLIAFGALTVSYKTFIVDAQAEQKTLEVSDHDKGISLAKKERADQTRSYVLDLPSKAHGRAMLLVSTLSDISSISSTITPDEVAIFSKRFAKQSYCLSLDLPKMPKKDNAIQVVSDLESMSVNSLISLRNLKEVKSYKVDEKFSQASCV